MTRRRNPAIRLVPKTEFFPVETRRLVTIGEDSPVWDGDMAFDQMTAGALVRVRAPPDVADEQVEAVRAWARKMGAEGEIRVLRRRRARLPDEALARVRKKRARARDVVLEVVEACSFEDKKALREACEAIMDEAGL